MVGGGESGTTGSRSISTSFLAGFVTATALSISISVATTVYQRKDRAKSDKDERPQITESIRNDDEGLFLDATKSTNSDDCDDGGNKDGSISINNKNSADRKEDMDSPELPLRMLRKAEAAILGRTSRIIVVIERCTDDHNYSAILRTVEALGIQTVWLIAPPRTVAEFSDIANDDHETGQTSSNDTTGAPRCATDYELKARTAHHVFAQKATEWLTLREFDSTAECLAALKEDQRTVWATDLSQDAVCLTPEDLRSQYSNGTNDTPRQDSNNDLLPNRLAIVFGTESVGCTNEMLTSCDMRVYLPLRGFADSLNLSVATALILHQLLHLCPNVIGDMSQSERRKLRLQWYSKLAAQRIMTRVEKKKRHKMTCLVRAGEAIAHRDISTLTVEQIAKLENAKIVNRELLEYDAAIAQKAKKSILKFVDDPQPFFQPLSDMRRADQHRVWFGSKTTVKNNAEFWADMPATGNYGTDGQMSSSKEFRSLLLNQDEKSVPNDNDAGDGVSKIIDVSVL